MYVRGRLSKSYPIKSNNKHFYASFIIHIHQPSNHFLCMCNVYIYICVLMVHKGLRGNVLFPSLWINFFLSFILIFFFQIFIKMNIYNHQITVIFRFRYHYLFKSISLMVFFYSKSIFILLYLNLNCLYLVIIFLIWNL